MGPKRSKLEKDFPNHVLNGFVHVEFSGAWAARFSLVVAGQVVPPWKGQGYVP